MAGEQATRIGARIRERRKELGLETQRELADLIDVPTINNQVVSNWERGVARPSDENMQRLATALKVEQAYFYAEPEPRESPDLMGALTQPDVRDQLDRIEAMLRALVGEKTLSVLGLDLESEQEEEPPASASA